METVAYHEIREPTAPAYRAAALVVPAEVPEASPVEEDSCCCGKPVTAPERCGCDGDPGAGADCCCKGA